MSNALWDLAEDEGPFGKVTETIDDDSTDSGAWEDDPMEIETSVDDALPSPLPSTSNLVSAHTREHNLTTSSIARTGPAPNLNSNLPVRNFIAPQLAPQAPAPGGDRPQSSSSREPHLPLRRQRSDHEDGRAGARDKRVAIEEPHRLASTKWRSEPWNSQNRVPQQKELECCWRCCKCGGRRGPRDIECRCEKGPHSRCNSCDLSILYLGGDLGSTVCYGCVEVLYDVSRRGSAEHKRWCRGRRTPTPSPELREDPGRWIGRLYYGGGC